jgi:hypothetical protein
MANTSTAATSPVQRADGKAAKAMIGFVKSFISADFMT